MPLKDDLAQQIRDASHVDVWDQFFTEDTSLHTWTLLQQLEMDMRLRSAIREARDKCLEAFDRLFTEKHRAEAFAFLKDQPLDERLKSNRIFAETPIATVFVKHTLPKNIKTWLAKQGGPISPDAIRIVSHVEHTPFHDVFSDNIYESYSVGGDAAMAEFNISADFNMIDPRAIAYAEQYSIRLSYSIADRIQDEIKYTMIEGVRQGEELRLIRDRILDVWDSPVPVHVRPRIDPDTGRILRQGYTYYLKPDNWAMLTSRTETLRWFNEGKLEGHQQLGVSFVEYQATGDHRTCPDCEAYQGEVFSVEDAHGLLPLHCRCRCTWRPIVGDPNRVMHQIDGIALSRHLPIVLKAFPIDVFREDDPEELEAMMTLASDNIDRVYDLLPPEEAVNPFDSSTLAGEIFEMMMPIIERKKLFSFVAEQVGDDELAREKIEEVEISAHKNGIVTGRWRKGEYKIVGVKK